VADEIYVVVVGVIAAFGAVGFGFKMQAAALQDLAGAIKELRTKLDAISAPSRDEHNQLARQVSALEVATAQSRVELENIRHARREHDGG
jgi:hypothetical protein